MERAFLGKTSLEISRLGFGCWQSSGWSSSDEAAFKQTLAAALERGINFIDTAEGYGDGHSETLVGEVIRGRRDSIVLATKFSHQNSAPERIRSSLENSLRRLKTDYIDLYQQHWPPKRPALEDTLDELVQLKEQGKIRAIGVSNWMEPEWNDIVDPGCIDALQPCHSILWRSIEKSVLPLCLKHNIAVLPYSPLAQGLLCGRFRSPSEKPSDHRRGNLLFSRMGEIEPILAVIDKIALKHSKTMGQVALRWLLDQPGITAPLVGASALPQLEENLGALGWSLPKEDWNEIETVSRAFSSRLAPHDTPWNWHPRKR